MNLDGLAFDEHRLEGLDAQTVQRRSAVQQNGMVLDDFFENVPDHRIVLFDQLLRLLNSGAVPSLLEAMVDERLEQLERHLLRQTALVELQLRPNHDDGSARVVDALSEQVLAEAALFALERIREALQRTIV